MFQTHERISRSSKLAVLAAAVVVVVVVVVVAAAAAAAAIPEISIYWQL